MPDQGLLKSARDLFDRGLYLQAFAATKPSGPLGSWSGVDAQIFGGRLAGNLGAQRLAAALFCRARRADHNHPSAAYYRAASLFNQRGPLRAWRFLKGLPEFPDAPPEVRADHLAIHARVLAAFRDFDSAECRINDAINLAPDRSWIWCERAAILRLRDAHGEAHESVQQALVLRPLYRPAVQLAAELLQLLRRDEEALALLCDANERLESGAIALQLAALQSELGEHGSALAQWQRGRELLPLAEVTLKAWLDGQLADACYRAGRFTEAANHARKVDTGFYRDFAERLEREGRRSRVILPVAFVAQHHMTCAPATLSALSAFWHVDVDHAALAAEICYEGTADHIERGWAEGKGFLAREFRVTWESACGLIDRGIPFTLTTVETTSAHLQALIGYDPVRKSFLLRDPSQRNHVEVGAEAFLERYAAFGPRGMVMIPETESHRLEGVDLPEADLYDHFYRFQRALDRHDRADAQREIEALEARAAGHRITLGASRRLATYDAHPARELEAVEALLAVYPKCPLYLWAKGNLLEQISPGKEHRRFLHERASDRSADPVFWFEWARTLGRDARHTHFAARYLLLALRAQPCEPGFLSQLGNSLWEERRFEAATDIYRLAACVGGVDRWGWSYFQACRHTRRTDDALHLLRAHYECARDASAQPARIFFNALVALDRSAEALALLEEAVSRRSEDGQLLVFAADEFARAGRWVKAEKLLLAAEPRVARSAWLRARANFADYRCDLASALEIWRMILAREPLAVDALRAIARLTAEIQGKSAALAILERETRRHPHFLPFAELHIEFLRNGPPEFAEQAIRRALARDSRNAWLRRELALAIANQRRFSEAHEEVEKGIQIDPQNPNSLSTRGRVFELEGRRQAAAENFQAALAISVDHTYAIEGLLRNCQSFAEKKAALDFVHAELVRQVVFGDGLLAFRDEGYAVLEPEALLEMLRGALAARPDLWQAWVVTIGQLVDLGRLDEALRISLDAVERFPLVPRVWFELSGVHRVRGARVEEIAPLRQALALFPAWGAASRALSDAFDRQGHLEEARATLERAIAAAPLDALNHGWLAAVLWKQGQCEKAVSSLCQALRLDPDYGWAWDVLKTWSAEIGKADMTVALARELAQERAGDARSWLRLADSLPREESAQAIEAVKVALSLEPHNVNAHNQLAVLHCVEGHFVEALAACAPPCFGDQRPLPLQGREAWIEAQRGSLPRAVEKMRAVVRDSPDYYWGWNQLADWLTAEGRYAEALEAARAMARLAPRSAVPLGYIADLQLHTGETPDAWESFQKAFHLDPNYQYAGARLFDGQLRSGDIEGAQRTLSLLELHHPGAQTDAARVRMLCWLGCKAEAMALLRKLCFVAELHSAALGEADDAIADAGWEAAAMTLYAEVLRDPAANPGVGTLWARGLGKRKFWMFDHGLASIDPRSPVGRAARITLLEKAAETGRRRFVERLLHRDGEALREDTLSWGAGGYALATLQQFQAVVRWLADWQTHSDAQPWMLYNLASALRAGKRDEEAHWVSVHAVSLPRDQTSAWHHLFLAWDEVMRGNFSAARQRIDDLASEDESLHFTVLRALVNAMVSIAQSAPSERAALYDRERLILRQSAWRAYWNEPTLRHMAEEGIRMMAETAGKKPFRLGDTLIFSRPIFEGSNFDWRWILLGVVAAQVIRACATSGA